MKILGKTVLIAGQILALIVGDNQTTSISEKKGYYQYYINV